MARRDWGQLGFADHMVMRHGRPNALLTRLTELIDWSGLERIVAGVHDSPHGAPAYPPSAMLKALLLQQWYGLSDPGLEEALWDRLSFRVFCGLPLGETAPDYSTINRFRNALSKDGLDRQVFEAINRQLDQKGLLLRKGTLIDASLIPAAVNPPKKPKEPLPPGPESRLKNCSEVCDGSLPFQGMKRARTEYSVHLVGVAIRPRSDANRWMSKSSNGTCGRSSKFEVSRPVTGSGWIVPTSFALIPNPLRIMKRRYWLPGCGSPM